MKLLELFLLFESPLKSYSPIGIKLKVKDAIGVPLYVNEVRGHVPRSRVIRDQVRWKMIFFFFFFFFFKLEVQLQPNLICRCNM